MNHGTRATASHPGKLLAPSIFPCNITGSEHLLMRKERAAPCRHLLLPRPCAHLLLPMHSRGPPCTQLMTLPPVPGELTFSSQAMLAAATQVTPPWCRAGDSHLTLLSSERTHCLRTEGKMKSALRIPHPTRTEPFIFACVPRVESYLCTCGGCKELVYYLFSFNDLCHSPLGIPICTMQIILSPWQ